MGLLLIGVEAVSDCCWPLEHFPLVGRPDWARGGGNVLWPAIAGCLGWYLRGGTSLLSGEGVNGEGILNGGTES